MYKKIRGFDYEKLRERCFPGTGLLPEECPYSSVSLRIQSECEKMLIKPEDLKGCAVAPLLPIQSVQGMLIMIQTFYDNGWVVGTVTWYNSKIRKLRIDYADGTDDFIAEKEFDNLELFLLEDQDTFFVPYLEPSFAKFPC